MSNKMDFVDSIPKGQFTRHTGVKHVDKLIHTENYVWPKLNKILEVVQTTEENTVRAWIQKNYTIKIKQPR